MKAVRFIDLNPLGACVAEKQQSDEKFSKREPRSARNSVTAHRGNSNFQFSFSNVSPSKALISNFDCLYLYYISRHGFHFLILLIFKLFCFENVQSDTHMQYPFVRS